MLVLQSVYACRERFRRIGRKYGAGHLKQLLTLVIPFVHIVYGDAALRLTGRDHRFVHTHPVHACTTVVGQQCGVDVHDPFRKGLHHFRWDEPQVTRQHDQIHPLPSQFTQQGSITRGRSIEQVQRHTQVPGPLHHPGTGSVTTDQRDLGILVRAEMLHQPLGIGTTSGSQDRHADHGAKVRDRSGIGTQCDLQPMMVAGPAPIPLDFIRYGNAEMIDRARAFHGTMARRRTVRSFSHEAVPFEVIAEVVRTAATAPSGAHKQPWTFCVVGDAALKLAIREAAEAEERTNYGGRMSDEWLEDLKPFGTDANKPFLVEAPWLVVVFKRAFEYMPDGSKRQNYYVNESVGIATGMLLAAAHQAGLATLTHTPSPMDFLTRLLGRPANERPFLLIPMGFPAQGCRVPDLQRKPLEEVLIPFRGT